MNSGADSFSFAILSPLPGTPIYRKVININEFENLNFYDARAIIKIFGSESGIFHSGKSGTNTIGFKKDE